eukprot:GHVU01122204.1.p1 GENE.GHVU01122204.1~~GHVU01122204.1.p1  ORF type:complete len:128 (-),score=14.61 GHVU01122204.1:506-889(-)
MRLTIWRSVADEFLGAEATSSVQHEVVGVLSDGHGVDTGTGTGSSSDALFACMHCMCEQLQKEEEEEEEEWCQGRSKLVSRRQSVVRFVAYHCSGKNYDFGAFARMVDFYNWRNSHARMQLCLGQVF